MSKTIKEFSEVVNLSIKMLEAPKDVLEFEKYDVASSNIDCVIALLKNLQPPKPPTCATCEHFTQELSNTGYCHKGIGQDYIRFTDGVTPFVFMDFSCNKHSDYGAANG